VCVCMCVFDRMCARMYVSVFVPVCSRVCRCLCAGLCVCILVLFNVPSQFWAVPPCTQNGRNVQWHIQSGMTLAFDYCHCPSYVNMQHIELKQIITESA